KSFLVVADLFRSGCLILFVLVVEGEARPFKCQFPVFPEDEPRGVSLYEPRIYFIVFAKSFHTLSKIVSIGTAVPPYRHRQHDILQFMLHAYQPEAEDRRKISLLYERSGIESRYSVVPDFSMDCS